MPRTVLVVDDERDTNDILANLVQARGFEPIQVFSGQQALAAVAEQTAGPDPARPDAARYRWFRALRPVEADSRRRT